MAANSDPITREHSGRDNPGDRPMAVLVICTGNQCRSPMVEALLRRRLADRDVPVVLASAGIVAEGRPASGPAVRVMADHGLDLSGHRSRILSPALVSSADLVLAMAREHVREAVVACPDAFPRTFTLRELVRRGSVQGPRPHDEALATWLARAHAGRTPSMHLGSSPEDDIADPIGQRLAVYERTADELVELVDDLVDLMWPEP